MRHRRRGSQRRLLAATGVPKSRRARPPGSRSSSPTSHFDAQLPLVSVREDSTTLRYRRPRHLLILSMWGAFTATSQVDLLSSNATNIEISSPRTVAVG